MGITKKFHEPETSSSGTRIHKSSRKPAIRPAHPNDNTYEDWPLDVLFRQIRNRLKRHWIAFCFRFHSLTLGLFRKQYALRMLSLTLLGYVLFSGDSSSLIADGIAREEASPQTVGSRSILTEQGLDFGARSSAGSASTGTPEREQLPPELATPKKARTNKPIAVSGADEKTRRYIERFHQVAIAEMRKYGVPASISLAQGLIESRSGSSTLAVRNNNHFGIKCFSKNCRKGHCSNHSDDTHKDFFRIYTNAWESWRAHSIMISSGKYAKLKKHGKDYRKWAQGLKKAGYATDASYDKKLIGIIERYNLQRFDQP